MHIEWNDLDGFSRGTIAGKDVYLIQAVALEGFHGYELLQVRPGDLDGQLGYFKSIREAKKVAEVHAGSTATPAAAHHGAEERRDDFSRLLSGRGPYYYEHDIDMKILLDAERGARGGRSSVVVEEHENALFRAGFLKWTQVHPDHQSLGQDHYELTDKGRQAVELYKNFVRSIGGRRGGEASESRTRPWPRPSMAHEDAGPGGALDWEQRGEDWVARTHGGARYKLVPEGSGFHASYVSRDGVEDLGVHGTLGAAMGAARRHEPGSGSRRAAEATGQARVLQSWHTYKPHQLPTEWQLKQLSWNDTLYRVDGASIGDGRESKIYAVDASSPQEAERAVLALLRSNHGGDWTFEAVVKPWPIHDGVPEPVSKDEFTFSGAGEGATERVPVLYEDVQAAEASESHEHKVGDTITLPVGTRVGMSKLKTAVEAKIDQIQMDNTGAPFYGVSWTDARTGRRRTTWWAPTSGASEDFPSKDTAEAHAYRSGARLIAPEGKNFAVYFPRAKRGFDRARLFQKQGNWHIGAKRTRVRSLPGNVRAIEAPDGGVSATRKMETAKESADANKLLPGEFKSEMLFDTIKARDRVTIVDRFGQQRTGRAVMRGPAGWVLNMGGRHGTPGIASPENVVRVVRAREPHGKPKSMAGEHARGLDAFTRGYVAAALWSSTDNADEGGGDPLDKNYSVSDIDSDTMEQMKRDCAKFQRENEKDLDLAYELDANARHGAAKTDYDQDHAGHDFWLTRNGHGVGFWDRGLGDIGDRLTEASKRFGEFDLYVGDDGKVHGSPIKWKGVNEASEAGSDARRVAVKLESEHDARKFRNQIDGRKIGRHMISVDRSGDVVVLVTRLDNGIVSTEAHKTLGDMGLRGEVGTVGRGDFLFKSAYEASECAPCSMAGEAPARSASEAAAEPKSKTEKAKEDASEPLQGGCVAIVERTPGCVPTGIRLDTPRQVWDLMHPRCAKLGAESFYVLLLSTQGELLGAPIEVAKGQADRVAVDIEQVVAPVITGAAAGARGFIVCHAHPSGGEHARPSDADRRLTKDIESSAKIACPSTAFIDHVVICAPAKSGEGSYFSFEENKLTKVSKSN